MDWNPLTLHHKPAVDEALQRSPLTLSDYNFTNLWMWNGYRRYEIAWIDHFLCIRFAEEGQQKFLYPLGEGSRIPIIRQLVEHTSSPFLMRAIPEEATDELRVLPWRLTPETEHFDYIYVYQDLVQLEGNEYQAKRNFIHQFENRYTFEYRAIIPEILPEVIDTEMQWFSEHVDPPKELIHEHEAALRALNTFAELKVLGGSLWVDNHPIAYSLADYLSCQMIVIHVEKALHAYKGAYAMINHQFLTHLYPVKYVNREEDLGFGNLIKVKQSYHPIRLEKKYKLKA